MTREQFTFQMSRLISVFKENSYPPERIKVLWDQVQQAEEEHFGRAVTRWIGEEKFAPMLPHFRDFYYQWMKISAASRQADLKTAINQDRACNYCGDEGHVLAWRHLDKTAWSFLCSFCEAARIKNMITIKDENGAYIQRIFWKNVNHSEYALKQIIKLGPEW